MSDFDGHIIELQEGDHLQLACLIGREKNRLRVLTERGREERAAEGRVLWWHSRQVEHPADWPAAAASLRAHIEALQAQVDVPLLWETVAETAESWDIGALADLYFGQTTPVHQSALWRALAEDRRHFRRRDARWVARTAEQIAAQQAQQQREEERAAFAARREAWLREVLHADGRVPVPEEMEPVLDQVATFLRQRGPGGLGPLLASLSPDRSAPEVAFDILLATGRLPEDADPDVLLAGLEAEFPPEVMAEVAALTPFVAVSEEPLWEVLCSIDDEETREVDDALGVAREEGRWRIDIAIADAARYVPRGSALEAEAGRRSATVYLPTRTILMLPEPISCDLASLAAGVPRPGILFQVWLDDEAKVCHSRILRGTVQVQQRLHYEEVDALLAEQDRPEERERPPEARRPEGPSGRLHISRALRILTDLAARRRAGRAARGAILQRRKEWKVKVENGEITVKAIDPHSPSRWMVAEMMILANTVAAEYADRHEVPILFRTQEAPLEPIPRQVEDDPLAFERIRRFLKPASLSLFPGEHFGLGVEAYTQLTSPLRRFADLVTQRQLLAHLAGQEPPYTRDELLTVLATAEAVERDIRKVEMRSERRWLLEYLLRYQPDKELEVLVLEEAHGGYRVELVEWGAPAFLTSPTSLIPGTHLGARIQEADPRRGRLRLRPA